MRLDDKTLLAAVRERGDAEAYVQLHLWADPIL